MERCPPVNFPFFSNQQPTTSNSSPSMPHTSQNDKTQLLTRGPVLRAIASIAIPMALVMVVNAVFSYLDLWFIARLGPDALHAMDVLFPYISLSNALVYAGLGTGVSVVVARQATRGGASWEGVLKAGLVLAIPLSLIFVLGAVCGKDVLLRALGTDASRAMAGIYSFWYFLFFPIMAFGAVISSAMRGTGHALRPALYSVGCIVLKAVLTPLLSYESVGLGWGIQGAAVSTVIAYSLLLLLLVGDLYRGKQGLRVCKFTASPDRQVYQRIVRSGIVAAQVPVLASVVLLLVLDVMSARSVQMADAFSLAKRFELYLIQLTVCLGCGTMVVMSASLEASHASRVWAAMRSSLKVLFTAGLPLVVGMSLFSDVFYRSLTTDSAIIQEGHKYFTYGGLHMLFTLGIILLNFGFQGIGRPFRALPYLVFSIVLVQGGGSWLLRSDLLDSSVYYVFISAGSALAFLMALRVLRRMVLDEDTNPAMVPALTAAEVRGQAV